MERRYFAMVLGLSLLAGCSSAGPAALPSSPTGQTSLTSSATYPANSSAARHILGATGSSSLRRTQGVNYGGHPYDDGGWSLLVLPVLQSCGNGAYSNNCANWVLPTTINRLGALGPGAPPVLDFCNQAADYPQATFGNSATPISPLGPAIFSLTYTGTQPLPIVTFVTAPWVASLTGSFAPTSAGAPNITVTPLLTSAAGRGWLLFFTWSWPADIFIVPYQVNEIQLAASSSPLGLPNGGSATLDAFDCLQQGIDAFAIGTGFSFSPPAGSHSGPPGWGQFPGFEQPNSLTTSSTGPVLQAPVYATEGPPQGWILLGDDRGATTLTTVGPATPSPAPTPTATASPAPTPSPSPTPGR
jgi:hypothetical protein